MEPDQQLPAIPSEKGTGKHNGNKSLETFEETMEARIERLGRERPPTFSSTWHELGFVFSVVMSQIMTEYLVSGFNVLLPTLIAELEIPESSSVWPATAFPLVIAGTLMLFGRIADQHGGYIVFLSGFAWLALWSLVAGFSINAIMLNFCRALQGLGAAAFLPTGVMLIGSAYRPGPRKNIVFSVYGSCAVIGFFMGIFFAGLVGQYARWGWYFWVSTILSLITFSSAWYFVPNDREERRKQSIESDWLGAITIVAGLTLLVFALTESAHTSWKVPYLPITFALSIVFLAIAVYIEGWVAVRPLLPADVFAVKGMVPLLLSLLLLSGTVGIFLLYGTQFFESYMHAKPLQIVAWYIPMVVGGLLLSLSEGFLLHIIPGYVLLIVSAIGAFGAQLLLALIPDGGSYWAWILPAGIMATIGIDLALTLMMVFVTTHLPLSKQGLGGGLVNSVLQLGMAVCLGLGDVIRTKTAESQGDRQGLKNVFWFGVAVGGTSLVLMLIWGRIPRQKSDLTADEKAELTRVASIAE